MKLYADLDAPVAPGKANLVTLEVLAYREAPVQSVKMSLGPVTRVVCGPTVMTAGSHVFMATVKVPDRMSAEVPLVVEVDGVRLQKTVPVQVPDRREPMPFSPHDPVLGPMWHQVSVESRLEPRGLALVARRGAVVARIQLEPRPEGAMLCARLSYPSLGLGLVAGLRAYGGERRRAEVVTYSPMLWGTAREARQTQEWFRMLGWVLDGVIVERLDDTGLVLCSYFGRADLVALRAFVARVLNLATAIEATRPRIMPPAPMRGHLAAWGKIAEELQGVLHPADLSIAGTTRGAEVTCDMAYQLGGYGTAMRVSVRPTGGAPARPRDLRGAYHADLGEEEIHFDMPPPFTDAGPILAVIRAAVDAAGAGPYR